MTGSRPDRLVAVVGTGTDVGKTWWAAAVLAAARAAGVVVAARKPAQSHHPDQAGATDAHVLGAATGEAPEVVCPARWWFAVPLAPPMAAEVLGVLAPRLAQVLPVWPGGIELGVVEAVGGVRSPLTADGDGLDLVAALAPDAVLLVADAGLGTISAVRLAVDALAGRGPWPTVVALNRFDPGDDLHRRNRGWLVDHDGLDVVVDPAVLAARWAR